MINISKKAAIRSPWFIGWMVILLTVVSVNVFMISLAMEGGPGIVAEDYYERGQTYDKERNERSKTHPGWTSQYKSYGEIYVNEETQIAFKLADKDGLAIKDTTVTLFIYRPSDKKLDFNVTLNTLDGLHYSNSVSFPLKGVWDLVVEIKKQDEVRNFAQRLTVYER